jgi:hypothetical protein
LPRWLAREVLGPLNAADKLNLKYVDWLQPAEDIYCIAGHFELFALIVDFLQ